MLSLNWSFWRRIRLVCAADLHHFCFVRKHQVKEDLIKKFYVLIFQVKVMHKQLLLFHNAISAYFAGNQQQLEETLKQFSIKLKPLGVEKPSWLEEQWDPSGLPAAFFSATFTYYLLTPTTYRRPRQREIYSDNWILGIFCLIDWIAGFDEGHVRNATEHWAASSMNI